MDIRNFFFKYRSYTPIPIAIMIIYFSQNINVFMPIGILFLLIGESIRVWSVSFAGGETRTVKVGAPELCTAGPYSYVRNPIYLGNMLMYIGIVIIAGSPNLSLMILTVFSFFIIQYTLIISLEEETLDELFGDEYIEYHKTVPAIFPRLKKWPNNDDRVPSSLIKTLKTEKRTLQNVTLILTLVVLRVIIFI